MQKLCACKRLYFTVVILRDDNFTLLTIKNLIILSAENWCAICSYELLIVVMWQLQSACFQFLWRPVKSIWNVSESCFSKSGC